MKNSITCFESFPNELLLELFEYLTPNDLYQIFFNLNTRFNVLIDSLRNLRLILFEDWDRDEQSSSTVPFYASQISTLIVKHDEPIDFSLYPNVRSLKLSMPTREQCNAIQATHLEHLYISNLYFTDHSEELCRLIFSSTFSRLQTCQIDRMTLNHAHSSSSSSSLRQLTISPATWTSNFYPIIFRSCPQLTHLKIHRLRKLPFELFSDNFLLHSTLRSLNFHFYSIGNDWFDHIDYLLSIVPNLEHLQLIIEQNDTNLEFPFERFALLLTQHVPYLRNFYAKLVINQFLIQQPETIQRLHALFFHVKFQRYTHRNLHHYLLISSK